MGTTSSYAPILDRVYICHFCIPTLFTELNHMDGALSSRCHFSRLHQKLKCTSTPVSCTRHRSLANLSGRLSGVREAHDRRRDLTFSYLTPPLQTAATGVSSTPRVRQHNRRSAIVLVNSERRDDARKQDAVGLQPVYNGWLRFRCVPCARLAPTPQGRGRTVRCRCHICQGSMIYLKTDFISAIDLLVAGELPHPYRAHRGTVPLNFTRISWGLQSATCTGIAGTRRH
ncbi:hypothetical protein BJV78DRAFT_244345 [Lactifluus subvellereus]|nr:hypothetical protein BJV78DRAFT_244345 [Lactifluus subvellereus]